MAKLIIRYGSTHIAEIPLALENVTVESTLSAANNTSGQVGVTVVNGRRGGNVVVAGEDSTQDHLLEVILQADPQPVDPNTNLPVYEIDYEFRRYLGVRDVLVELLS